jgi:hypothetical protein
MLGEAVQVAQKQGLVTGILPDDADLHLVGKLLCLLAAVRIVLNLIKIEKYRSARKLCAPLLSPHDLLLSPTQAGDRVARSGTKIDDFEVNRSARRLQQIVEQLAVSLFGLPFAAQEDRRLRLDKSPPHPHPTCGTAPYTPPRYFL